MTVVLESYVTGKWVAPEGDTVPLINAVTGEEVSRFPSGTLDVPAVIAYGREVGGPALRALTFHQRASALKALGKLLLSRKEEFYPISAATGATTRDSAIDVDGGFGTLFSYASKGVRELPNDTIYLDGGTEILGRGCTFVGQHIYTSRPGVAVQINAFNFPVWGMLEKLAPAFLARGTFDRQAGTPDRLPDRSGIPRGRRIWVAARRVSTAGVREPARTARPPRQPRHCAVHRVGLDRGEAAQPPQCRREGRAFQR
jgi:hypothetical protein